MQFEGTAAPSADKKGSATGRYVAQLPLLQRIGCYIRLRLLQTIFSWILWAKKVEPYDKPTLIKSYRVNRPKPLPASRVFIPPDYKSGSKKLYPLHIDIHGGGFAIASPKSDDFDNACLSKEHGILCVSIGYSLSPQSPWPAAVHDVAAQIEAIIDDPSLPIDKSKVSVGGYSGGGNLSFTSVQTRGLHKKVAALVGVYPSLDFIKTLDEKLASATVAAHRKADVLERLGPLFQWGYLPVGQDKHDPLISPIMAKRENLPKKLLFIGCEHDMLNGEAKEMSEKIAKADGIGKREEIKIGKMEGWKQGNVQYINLLGMEHGFNNMVSGISKAQIKENRERAYLMHEQIAKWLKEEVYASR